MTRETVIEQATQFGIGAITCHCKKIVVGVFRTNDWIREDFKGLSFQRANKGKFFVMLNPYEPISECGILPKNLKKGDKIKDKDGIILKVVDFGGAGLFGKENFSWIWIGFSCVNSTFQNAITKG
jgi:hypothetical protein